jgi:hypothetical protein
VPVDQAQRLAEAERAALEAERSEDVWAANAAWERHRLIETAMMDPQERLDEGVALSKRLIRLWMTSPAS